MTSQTAQLEREAEEARNRVERTLAELRHRASPGHMVDQATDYLRNSSGRALMSNLRTQVVANPLPVALVGAGIAWLAASSRATHRDAQSLRGYPKPRHVRPASATGDAQADNVDNGDSETWMDATSRTAAEVGEKAEEYWDGAQSVYQGAKETVRGAANAAMEQGRTLRDAIGPDGTLVNFCRQQPMLMAGLGLAIGAALGGLVSATEPERRLMAGASRKVKDEIKDIADEVTQPLREKVAQGDPTNGSSRRPDDERPAEPGAPDRPEGNGSTAFGSERLT